ncbi:hypothetical protein [Nocardioides stalactiti]|uniref:hypothetical protein n=1 Tax=Nocardioides stalactiti TaxID=2755356 RepID=UPI001603371D|nr:hypothetical protein [Nocardioides stalactiti]
MAASADYYDDLVDAFGDPESLTLLVVAGATRDCVARALDVDLHEPVAHPWDEKDDTDYSAWALVEIDGGVIGVEHTGYGDPAVTALEVMARGGNAAAVVRSNPQAPLRFGCARHGGSDDASPDGFSVGLVMAEDVTGLELTHEHAMLLAAAQFFRGPSIAPAHLGGTARV